MSLLLCPYMVSLYFRQYSLISDWLISCFEYFTDIWMKLSSYIKSIGKTGKFYTFRFSRKHLCDISAKNTSNWTTQILNFSKLQFVQFDAFLVEILNVKDTYYFMFKISPCIMILVSSSCDITLTVSFDWFEYSNGK